MEQQVNVNELFMVIGRKTVENEMLVGQLNNAQIKINELESQITQLTLTKDESNLPR